VFPALCFQAKVRFGCKSTAALLFFASCCAGVAGSADPSDALALRAAQEFLNNDFPAAERDYRQVVKENPSNIIAEFYLGQVLSREEKYADAALFFQKARDLEKGGQQLTKVHDRILTDQLVMSYGISGDLKTARALLREAIAKDPDYPLNYYNLACTDAEEDNKSGALANLQRAFDRKAEILSGEKMPDPGADSSFQKYRNDPDFLALIKKLGLK
jgi:tetratricopeptide (TPR) repeat protein